MSETSGVVRTEGRVLNAGSRVATAEARITDAKGRLLMHATTTCLVFEFPKASAKG
jgi:acyl-coenzyme A thioesterase PaaI-like protein